MTGRSSRGAPAAKNAAALARLAMSEDELLEQIRQMAGYTGWMFYHTHDSRGSDPGWPDVVLASRRQRRLMIVELKREKETVTTEQQKWLDLLVYLGVETAVWRPSDLDTALAVMQGRMRLGGGT